MTVEDIEREAMSRWQSILCFLVCASVPWCCSCCPPDGACVSPLQADGSLSLESATLSALLQRTGLVRHEAEQVASAASDLTRSIGKVRVRVVVTSAGYEFMLKDVQVQLWMFIAAYLSSLDALGLQVALLSLLFQLSFCRVGDAFPVSALPDDAARVINDLESFGIVIRGKDRSMYACSVAVCLHRE
jgi:hypothetical protein